MAQLAVECDLSAVQDAVARVEAVDALARGLAARGRLANEFAAGLQALCHDMVALIDADRSVQAVRDGALFVARPTRAFLAVIEGMEDLARKHGGGA